jgi:hypothetical protein
MRADPGGERLGGFSSARFPGVKVFGSDGGGRIFRWHGGQVPPNFQLATSVRRDAPELLPQALRKCGTVRPEDSHRCPFAHTAVRKRTHFLGLNLVLSDQHSKLLEIAAFLLLAVEML